ISKEVELMRNVTVGQRIIEARIQRVDRAVSKRIALVRVVILVMRINVVPFELVAVTKPLPHTDCKPVIDPLAVCASHKHIPKGREKSGRPIVEKARQVYALRVSVIYVQRKIRDQLLLKLNVCRIYLRILIILAEYTN